MFSKFLRARMAEQQGGDGDLDMDIFCSQLSNSRSSHDQINQTEYDLQYEECLTEVKVKFSL